MSSVIEKLAILFARFPGIGGRQSKRFVFFLLRQQNGFLDELSSTIKELKSGINTCSKCFRYYDDDLSGNDICELCADSNRNQSTLLIVERDTDMEVVEKSGSYNGLYFVLGGTVPILEEKLEKVIRLKQLMKRVTEALDEEGINLKEIILATSFSPEGENTADIIRKNLETILKDGDTKISTLGKGLSTGTELEYSDAETIKHALKNRGS